jgi:hypothetical protein
MMASSSVTLAEEAFAATQEECAVQSDGTTTCTTPSNTEATIHESVSTADGTNTNKNSSNKDNDDNNNSSCPSRSHIIKCAGAHLDLNHNGKLERAELQSAIDSLPWYARGEWCCAVFDSWDVLEMMFTSCLWISYMNHHAHIIIGILNILGSVDKMMKKCDVDGDDAIGMDYDMAHNQEACLATCLKRRVFKSAFFPQCDL